MIIDIRSHYKQISQEANNYSQELEDRIKQAMSYMYKEIRKPRRHKKLSST